MYIMTKDGWRLIATRNVVPAGHTPSLLDNMGIDMSYDGEQAMCDYANSNGHGYYYHYTKEGAVARDV